MTDPTCAWCRQPNRRPKSPFCSRRCGNRHYYAQNRSEILGRQHVRYQRDRERILDRQRDYGAQWREANRERVRAKHRQDQVGRRRMLRAAVFQHYGNTCALCGSDQDLTLDHVNGDGAAHRRMLRERGVAGTQTGYFFYEYLVRGGFDSDGFELQTLCECCHIEKSRPEISAMKRARRG